MTASESKLGSSHEISNKNSNKEGWDIYPETDPTINSLRYLNDFDLFLIKLHRADVKLIIDRYSDFDTVYSVNEPEATYE